MGGGYIEGTWLYSSQAMRLNFTTLNLLLTLKMTILGPNPRKISSQKSRFLVGTRDFLFSKVSNLQFGPVALSAEVNRPQRGAERSLPSSAGVKNGWSCTFTLL